MSVDISGILHVLAHELRTPVGIAHGYVRLLLEDRLPQDHDRRRALEQMQKALGRLTELSHESTRLAAWFEQDHGPVVDVSARSVLARAHQAEYDAPVRFDVDALADAVLVRTPDAGALATAIIQIVRATARELGGRDCAVLARLAGAERLEILVGDPDLLPALAAGRESADASPLALERGGLGLSLLHAAIVLDAHGAAHWTLNHSRRTAGFRIPVAERSIS